MADKKIPDKAISKNKPRIYSISESLPSPENESVEDFLARSDFLGRAILAAKGDRVLLADRNDDGKVTVEELKAALRHPDVRMMPENGDVEKRLQKLEGRKDDEVLVDMKKIADEYRKLYYYNAADAYSEGADIKPLVKRNLSTADRLLLEELGLDDNGDGAVTVGEMENYWRNNPDKRPNPETLDSPVSPDKKNMMPEKEHSRQKQWDYQPKDVPDIDERSNPPVRKDSGKLNSKLLVQR